MKTCSYPPTPFSASWPVLLLFCCQQSKRIGLLQAAAFGKDSGKWRGRNQTVKGYEGSAYEKKPISSIIGIAASAATSFGQANFIFETYAAASYAAPQGVVTWTTDTSLAPPGKAGLAVEDSEGFKADLLWQVGTAGGDLGLAYPRFTAGSWPPPFLSCPITPAKASTSRSLCGRGPTTTPPLSRVPSPGRSWGDAWRHRWLLPESSQGPDHCVFFSSWICGQPTTNGSIGWHCNILVRFHNK